MKKSVRKTRSTAPTRRKKRTVARREPSLKPERITAKLLTESRKNKKKKTDGSGPLEWLLPMFESAYTPLEPKGTTSRAIATATASSFDIAATATLAAAAPTMWRDIFLKYKQRKVAAAPAMALGAPPAPFVPGARNWLPLGPSVVMDGQTVGSQPVAGRVSRIAVAPGGAIVYAATATGGVFRSVDGGTTWRSTMDRFDMDPTNFASASLVCGAIAIDRVNPNRVYVGTGEGDTLQLFRSRVVSALPAYRGVGVIRSDDGGDNWIAEPSFPDLAGEAFFSLAVDPANRESVVGATTIGLFRRVPVPGGQFRWESTRPGVYASVIAATAGGTTHFFAAEWGQGGAPSQVLYSNDGGGTWGAAGTGFPTGDVGRVALAGQTDDPNRLYAFVTTGAGQFQGLYRLDGLSQAWKSISNVPPVLPGGQGSYDLTIAVDPTDPNLVYLGGDRMDAPPWGGSIWRCTIQASGGSYRVGQSASIGTHAHADVHYLCHTPDDPNELWCGCDGGVFLNRDAKRQGEFVSQNNGLACLCSNFIAQHPTDPNILFSGLQDNGTARTASGSIWNHVMGGDGGYCLINWKDPNKVLAYANGVVYRSTTGGASHAGWETVWNFGWATMTQPIVGVPYDPAHPANADLVALGAGSLVYISNNFATTWGWKLTLPGGATTGAAFALAFASTDCFFIGTTRGQVFRADRTNNTWSLTRLDNAAGGPLGVSGLIADVAVDWADASRRSVYVAFGGIGDRRRVWHFDGSRWRDRSGTGATGLLDVEHNALAVDPTAPNNIYAGADIGVWHSADGGVNWNPFENGLPDAPVFDLQIHPTQRLLRAATHGRGVYEISLQ